MSTQHKQPIGVMDAPNRGLDITTRQRSTPPPTSPAPSVGREGILMRNEGNTGGTIEIKMKTKREFLPSRERESCPFLFLDLWI